MPRSYEKHGLRKHELYETWASIKKRCYYKGSPSYKRYGGRGVSVCGRWRNSFLSFLEDMGERPTPTHSVDRIDVDGDYEPGNCRWATPRVQEDNKRGYRAASRRNTSGVVGVSLREKDQMWIVKYKSKVVLRTKDFYEACCVRKSMEV